MVSTLKFLTAAVCVAALFAVAAGATVESLCLGCLCEATSGCNQTIGCSGDICGAFRITWAYWADGGKPTIENSNEQNAFSQCVNDVYCAARAVEGYMQRYGRDCNKDGVVNCDDFLKIHFLGPYGCEGPIDPKFETPYRTCREHFH